MRNMKIVITKAALAAAMILPCVQAAPVQAAETEKTRLIEVVTSSMATVQEEVKTLRAKPEKRKLQNPETSARKLPTLPLPRSVSDRTAPCWSPIP